MIVGPTVGCNSEDEEERILLDFVEYTVEDADLLQTTSQQQQIDSFNSADLTRELLQQNLFGALLREPPIVSPFPRYPLGLGNRCF